MAYNLTIKNVKLKGNLILAPMAGVTDRAFRQICREHGAALSVSEMISTKALLFNDQKTRKLLSLAPNESPASVQIFGSDPDTMARGAEMAQYLSGCQLIDINMGCPAPKITSNGDGSALMKNISLASKIIEAVSKASPVPVTVKFRKGWDFDSINYLDFAKMAENSGASAICIHGRTRSQMYSGKADWDCIAEIKAHSGIPVIANGDVFTPEDAEALLMRTKADGVMIGRGALGNPWLFEQTNALLNGGKVPPLPPLCERLNTAVKQIELAAQQKGERIAMLEARKHMIWYLKGVPGMREMKNRVSGLSTLSELLCLIEELNRNEKGGHYAGGETSDSASQEG